MIDRLVCADGGNPDPSSTPGKQVEAAKRLELAGWDYPKHLAGHAYGVIVHGDVAGIEPSRRALSDWLAWTGLVESGAKSRLDRYIGYYEPYATSHAALDRDEALRQETANVAEAVAVNVARLRQGHAPPDAACQVARRRPIRFIGPLRPSAPPIRSAHPFRQSFVASARSPLPRRAGRHDGPRRTRGARRHAACCLVTGKPGHGNRRAPQSSHPEPP
ncbi:hypothetical protein FBX98_101598 [Burkholderia sp. SJZ115]|nr:hypothetical protein FB600_101598 [Burkholderia sp. SJZ089]TWD09231.1 hypothetical protein FBX98_101598 [Burkholderia sp. SJZ115]TWD12366.1 hypothetical protein FB601_101599 [Burkholderia sp. SJZ091]